MNLTQILKTKNVNGTTPLEAIEKHTAKELKITLDRFAEDKNTTKLKANFRRIVDLILERSSFGVYDLLDLLNPDFLDFIEYEVLYATETKEGAVEVLMSKNLKWRELQRIVMEDDWSELPEQQRAKMIISKRRGLRNALKLKDIFGGEIVG